MHYESDSSCTDKFFMCTIMIVISSVRLSCSSQSLYASPVMAEHASRGSSYLLTYAVKEMMYK